MYLSIKMGSKTHIEFIEKLPVSIGRGPENDIVINRDTISRKHATIEQGEFGVYLKDNDSVNGIHINGSKKQDHELVDEDIFALGDVVITYHDDHPEHATRKIIVPPNTSKSGFQRIVPALTTIAILVACGVISGLVDFSLIYKENALKVVFEKVWKNFVLTGTLAIVPIIGNLIYSKRILILPFLQRVAILLFIYQMELRYRSFYQFNLQLDFLKGMIAPLTICLIIFYMTNYIYKLNHENVFRRRLFASLFAATAAISFTVYKGITNAKSNGIDLGLYSAYPMMSKSTKPLSELEMKLKDIGKQTAKESEELRSKLVQKGIERFDTYPASPSH